MSDLAQVTTGRTVAAAALSATIMAVLPVFLVGGLAAFVRPDLGFDEAALGLLAGSFFGAAALVAMPAGGVAARVGEQAALRIGLSLVAAGLSLAAVAPSVLVLAVALMVSGVGNGFIQPSANQAIARGIATARQGMAFGIKQAGIPSATLLAGVALPVIGSTVGWRWAFAGSAVIALGVRWRMRGWVPGQLPRSSESPSLPRDAGRARRGVPTRAVLVLAVAGGCGSAASNSLGSFYVDWAVSAGWSVELAGAMLGVASAAGLAARLAVGWSADRLSLLPQHLIAAMLAIGAVAYLGLAQAGAFGWLAASSIIAYVAGWGWPGLIHLAVVRASPGAPAVATGGLQLGLYAGGVFGPIAFGWIARTAGYDRAWTAAAISALAGGGLLALPAGSRRQEAGCP